VYVGREEELHSEGGEESDAVTDKESEGDRERE
jgi:hypothetical protein